MPDSIYFSDLASITQLTADVKNLPPNIVIASGATRHDRRIDAARILNSTPEVNAVAIIEPQRPQIDLALKELFTLANDKRISKKHSLQSSTSISDTFMTYAIARYNQLNAGCDRTQTATVLKSTVDQISNFWDSSLQEGKDLPNLTNTLTTTTYAPQYRQNLPTNTINVHIDAPNDQSDIRLIEVVSGSGTLVFSDNDFEVLSPSEAIPTKRIRPLHTGIDCWELLAGSSLVIRNLSDKTTKMGARPTVHAHGLGSLHGTEQRLTYRHDFIMA